MLLHLPWLHVAFLVRESFNNYANALQNTLINFADRNCIVAISGKHNYYEYEKTLMWQFDKMLSKGQTVAYVIMSTALKGLRSCPVQP